MPPRASSTNIDWKVHESTLRLLCSILAANPALRLDYGEISKCFGGGSTKFSVENRMRRVRSAAECIRKAVDAGEDPFLSVAITVTGGSEAGPSGTATPEKPPSSKGNKRKKSIVDDEELADMTPVPKKRLATPRKPRASPIKKEESVTISDDEGNAGGMSNRAQGISDTPSRSGPSPHWWAGNSRRGSLEPRLSPDGLRDSGYVVGEGSGSGDVGEGVVRDVSFVLKRSPSSDDDI